MLANSSALTLIGITLVTLALTGCSALGLGIGEQDEPYPPPRAFPAAADPSFQDAGSYAKYFGVTLEEASRQVALQDDVVRLQAQLASAEQETFGGLWIQHEPAYAVVVTFTQDGEQTIRRYIEGTPLEELVELRTVHYSLQALEALQQQATATVAKLGIHADTSRALEDNHAELYIGNAQSLADELAKAGLELPEGVVVVETGGPGATNHPYLEEHRTSAGKIVYFPKQASTLRSMAALLKGTLVEEDGCLRIHYSNGTTADNSVLVIWFNDHLLHIDEQGMTVANGEGEIIGRVGGPISIGGGHAGIENLDAELQQVIPAACHSDSYWLAGK